MNDSNDKDFEEKARRIQTEEALTEVWRSVMLAVSTNDILPISDDVENAQPPYDLKRLVFQVEDALHLLQRSWMRSAVDTQRVRDMDATIAALRRENDALRGQIESQRQAHAEMKSELVVARMNLERARTAETSIFDYKKKLASLPAEAELKTYVATLQNIVDILAPSDERRGFTPEQIVERVREMRDDYKNLEKLSREALGIDDYKPIVDSIRALRDVTTLRWTLLEHIRKALGIDAVAFELNPFIAFDEALKARTAPDSEEEVRR